MEKFKYALFIVGGILFWVLFLVGMLFLEDKWATDDCRKDERVQSGEWTMNKCKSDWKTDIYI